MRSGIDITLSVKCTPITWSFIFNYLTFYHTGFAGMPFSNFSLTLKQVCLTKTSVVYSDHLFVEP